jgi:hypothetical protein
MIRRLAAALLVRLAKRKAGLPPYAFHDHKGRAYYAWQDVSDVPEVRRHELETVMLWIDAGRPEQYLDDIADAIAERHAQVAATKDPKERARILASATALTRELKVRAKDIIPEECYYALAAIACVREDEDPQVMDRAIHMDKIETFRAAGRAGHAFFTGTPLLRALLAACWCTDAGFRQLQVGWIAQQARHRAMMRACSLDTPSPS